MHALPLAIALVAAAALAPALLRALQAAQHVKPNYRGRPLPFPLGALTPAAALVALFVTSFQALSDARWLLASAVLVLATHFFNLLDLRPGRATKALLILGAGLLIGSQDARPLWSLGLFAGPALVAGLYDLRERA